MSRVTTLEKKLLTPPQFSNYDGGNDFIFEDKTYKKQEKKLGKGGYGEVYCFIAEDGSQVAVKSELPDRGNYFCGSIFQKEAEWYQEIYGRGVFSGNTKNTRQAHHILIPYFKGKTLYHVEYAHTKDIFRYWIKTADAVHQLHQEHQLIHCDLKADNVIFGKRTDQLSYTTEEPKVFVIDFGGISKKGAIRLLCLSDEKDNRFRYRQHPPEIFSNQNQKLCAHPSQDIYALGILLQDVYFLYSTKTGEEESLDTALIETIRTNLTQENPDERWPIAKAIYMMIASFFTRIQRDLWLIAENESKLHHQMRHESFIRDIWKSAAISAIRIRYCELELEQENLLERKNNRSTRKDEKINGLKKLESQIQIHDPRLIKQMIEKTEKQHPELTAGIFSRRTEIMLDDLMLMTRILH